ncbi:PEP/pyruvate-binding domain-containing protein [Tessaracoccus caeni]|uniref:PEP/pyruvate-binding domain-containing protein n=1 Tax=Tessaracoccus caeni TaxID=3031239 RepID=UPI0023DA1387|nr:PEP/pyruvate-binding domain-containing protein [Tessaracoccus caeni]MDF1489704.1 PEP/pyruvate-binding domain-containing protein [Tessaracoccus caeni]
MITTSVFPLQTFGARDGAAVGGKAANLGEMLRVGMPVPPGFVVTTNAYAEAAESARIADLLTNPDVSPSALRDALLAISLPEELREQITDAYRDLGDDAPVAVRSSATAEDLPGTAFAGQQDTYLNVVSADAVVDAVQRCWASLWSDRAVAYRRQLAIPPAEVRIAVVVQRMVEAEVAGVMFTADPVSGARDRVIVDAARGLGEAVVSGLVTPDHYVLDATGTLLEWTPGRAEVVIRSVSGGGVRHDAADAGTGRPLLGDATLKELADHATRLATHFGRPQDIEWAWADGRIWITQSRPMTALPPDTGPLSFSQRLQASVLTEFLPSRPYPLDVTTLLTRGPATMMNEITRHYGLRHAFDLIFREEDGVLVEFKPRAFRPGPKAVLNPIRIPLKARRFRPSDWARDPRQLAFVDELERLESLDLSTVPWPSLVQLRERSVATLDYCRDIRIDYLPGALLAIARLALLTVVLRRRHLLTDLAGGGATITDAYNSALAELADEVRATPSLVALFTEQEAADVWTELTTNPEHAAFRGRTEAFLRTYGRKETASPLLVSAPTLAESPEIVVGLIGSLAQRPARDKQARSRSAAALAELLTHPLLRSRRTKERVRRWVSAAQEGVAFREDTHVAFSALLPSLRRSVLEIARRLHRAGLLAEESDVFHLRWDEIKAIHDPDRIPGQHAEQLRAAIRQRAAKRAELGRTPLIDLTRVFPRTPDGDALATGTPACAGTVTAVARVVHGPEEFHRLRAGEVLVCPYTNPAWTPLFQQASAVVVDTGAIASHAAIVAREYGIPAVMGTRTGTTAIADGQLITVDGTRGRVTVGAP